MRLSLFATCFVVTIVYSMTSLFGQIPDSVGLDNEPILNNHESLLLNSMLQKERDTFNFDGKKIAFVTGSAGGKIIGKIDYFNKLLRPWVEGGISPHVLMVKLTDGEKVKSGGYDAIVMSWVKLFTNGQRTKIIARLNAVARLD